MPNWEIWLNLEMFNWLFRFTKKLELILKLDKLWLKAEICKEDKLTFNNMEEMLIVLESLDNLYKEDNSNLL